MLRLFTRQRRRPAPRRPYNRLLSVECLESRDAPSSLAPTSQSTAALGDPPYSTTALIATDPSTDTTDTTTTTAAAATPATTTDNSTSTAPATAPATTTATTNTTATSTAPVTTTTGTSAPAPATTSSPAPATTPGSPVVSSGITGTLNSNGSGSTTSTAAPNTVDGPPVIDGYEVTEDVTTWSYTIYGHVSWTNPTSLTVTFSGGVLDGEQAAVDGEGEFQITFQLPACTSSSTGTHDYGAVASDGNGNTSAEVIIVVQQTPQPPPPGGH